MLNKVLNIDDFVNYREEYSSIIKKCKISGNRLIGLCPFHNDSNPSFSVDLTTGQWICFTENIKGNYINFYSRYYNITEKEAYKEILKKYNKYTNDYTIEDYCLEKRLPVEWLKNHYGVQTSKNYDGRQYVKMPYYNENMAEVTFRKRFNNKELRWAKGSSGKICLYNLWSLANIKNMGYVILCEGESDTQTLTYLGLPALGVAGASLFKNEYGEFLRGLKVYIHQEPDTGGETFFNKVVNCLKEIDFKDDVYVFSCGEFNAKDPSQLYIDNGKEKSKEMLLQAMEKCEKVDIFADRDTLTIVGQPIPLKQPLNWYYCEDGVFSVNGKTGEKKLVCRTPIIISKRLRTLETGEEKIEISFKRDNIWHSGKFTRSTIFTSKGITVLADMGCTVTSENAKHIVKYLSALESENLELIPKVDCVNSFGWHNNSFVPSSKDLEIDIDMSQKNLVDAYCQSGSYEDWKAMVQPHRQRNKFRFILASSFSAPLLKILKHRIFFVYNWGGSKGGKTAALKSALSVWGEPEALMMNFNATQVGLERMAGFYCDLPLGIDERQLAGNGLYSQNSLEKIVYMISGGQGRIRGNKGGGLQHTQQWRTVAIATGEEPISTSTSQTGVSTRTIEVYGAPFDNEEDASNIHRQTAINYGWAGNDYINHIVNCTEEKLVQLYEKMTEEVTKMSKNNSGSHISSISLVALADALCDCWLFEEQEELNVNSTSWNKALEMAKEILSQQFTEEENDVNENAKQFVVDWILSNKDNFGLNARSNCLGFINDDKAYILPTLLKKALKDNGFSARKSMNYFAEKGIITSKKYDTQKTYSITKRFNGRSCRFVEFHLNCNIDEKEEVNDFYEIDINDDVTPF